MSGTTANLDNPNEFIDTGKDCITIVSVIETIPGGKTLDVSNFELSVIKAGHIIIEETATENLKPMPITGNAYAALPAGHTYKGVLTASILTKKPFAAIMVRGSVNKLASPYPVTQEVEAALYLIRFTKD